MVTKYQIVPKGASLENPDSYKCVININQRCNIFVAYDKDAAMLEKYAGELTERRGNRVSFDEKMFSEILCRMSIMKIVVNICVK